MNIAAIWKKWSAKPWVQFPVTVMTRFGEDNGGLFAAGLAFFMLLSFAPLILTGVAVLGFFINPHAAQDLVRHLAQNMVPSGGAQSELSHFFDQRLNVGGQVQSIIKGRTLAGIIGFVTLIWTSMQIFINASTAMNAAFEVKEKRSWFGLRGIALGLLVASGILVTIALFLSAAPSAASNYHLPIMQMFPVPFWVVEVFFEVLAILLNALLYVVIYKYLPSAEVNWKSAFVGGLVASVCWEVAKKGIASYLLKPNASLYGGLSELILFVLWIYYSMMILLIGAEVAAVHQKSSSKRGKPSPATSRTDLDEQPHKSDTHPVIARQGKSKAGRS